jgi:hypothetical protein
MTNKQVSDQYFLKRICLAKAIKSMDEIGKDSWEKSVIFNQPFVKEILSHKQQVKEATVNKQPVKTNVHQPSNKTRREYKSKEGSKEKTIRILILYKSTFISQKTRNRIMSNKECHSQRL